MRKKSVNFACLFIAIIVFYALNAGAVQYLAGGHSITDVQGTFILAASSSSGYGGSERTNSGKDTTSGGSYTFNSPTFNGMRVDATLSGDSPAGKPAANRFCRQNGYSKARSWKIAPNIGHVSPTIRLGDGEICNQQSCSGFTSIECQ